MCRGTLYAYVPSPHDSTLARIEGELEFSFEYDAVVDGHGAVERRFEAGAEVYDADDGAGFNVQTWLCVQDTTSASRFEIQAVVISV